MTSDTSHPASQPKSPDPSPVMSRVLAQAVHCNWRTAYDVAADPARMPEWASGLAKSKISQDEAIAGEWLVDSPSGHARIRFAPRNDVGVLDHWVTPEGVAEVYMPFRVIATGPGRCEFQLTLLRQPEMDEAAFERDSDWIRRDLELLRGLLEAG